MFLRQFRAHYFKIFFAIIIFLSIYNFLRLFHLDKLKFDSFFFPDSTKHIHNNNRNDMKAENLHIVPLKVHKHLTEGLNNSLFLRQGKFKLPPDSKMIHGDLPFDIFPSKDLPNNDRIWHQMRYVPPHLHVSQATVKDKLILLYNGLAGTNNKAFEVCPVHKCKVTDDREQAKKADVVLWMHNVFYPFHKRPPGQIWAVFFLESPIHTPQFPDFERHSGSQINWTATYRRESTIVAPYFKYTPYDLINPPPERYPLPKRNYASGKTKMVAWFVSNCASLNGRMNVAKSMKKYIQVDIFGACGTLSCPRNHVNDCFTMLNKHYKFYLAFENSNCKDYITEKFFLNGLSNDVLPIVMGGPPSHYKRSAPPHSYIHVEDFDDVEGLVKYMQYLDKNDTAYNEYFSWKGYGMVDTNTFFWCRLCMMAHEGDRVKTVFPNVFDWWNGINKKICIGSGKWKDQNNIGV